MVGGADREFTGAIPEVYETYLVPLIFEEYAFDLASLVAAGSPRRVLEVAAGTGVATRAMAALMSGVEITATDLNQAMLDHAASMLVAPGLEWRQANALELPFEDGTFDAVACQFGVMFFPDRPAAYREARRVLEPGGRFIFNTWDRIEENEVPMAVSDAVASVFPDNPPSFLRRTPHGYHDLDVVRTELEAAGFVDVRVATVEHRSRASTARDPAVAFCAGTPLRNEIEERDASMLDAAIERATTAVAKRFGATGIDGKIQAHVVVAR